MLSIDEIKRRLAYANLSKVARGTGLDVRTIKGFIDGRDTKWSTIKRLEEFLNV